MIIRRADVTRNFTIIPNAIAQSQSLSPNAKSLIIHLLSMPDNWYYVKTQFWRITNLGRKAFNTAWKELEQIGYIRAERIKEGNLVRGYNYIISDLPIYGLTENGVVQNVDIQKVVSNKRNSNKEINNKKRGNIKAEVANKLTQPKSLFDIISLHPNLSSEEQIKIYHEQL